MARTTRKRYVIGCQIFREALRDFADERGDQLLGGDLAEKIGDAEQTVFAEHFAIGVT